MNEMKRYCVPFFLSIFIVSFKINYENVTDLFQQNKYEKFAKFCFRVHLSVLRT